MNIFDYGKYVVMGNNFLQIGFSKDHAVFGFCFFEKYCWTNVFGYEKIK